MQASPLRVLTRVVLWLACAWAVEACAADTLEQITAALQRPILPAGEPLREIKAFVAPRIVPPPRVTDRAEWERTAARLRRDVLDGIVFRGRAGAWRDAKCRVEWLDTIAGGPGYKIRKFRYEALPGMWIPALLYEPERLSGRVPVVLNVNGHDPVGKAADYKQLRAINQAKRGMLALNVEWFGMGQLRTDGFAHGRMNQLDLCGASGLAPFYLAMSRALDVGLSHEHADSDRVAVAGLSGGGWQTILISSLDERVTLANPVAGYGSFHTNIAFDDMGDSEQAPTDLAALADYTHLTALRAPRPTLLTYNANDDCCFKSAHTLGPLLDSTSPVYALYGAADRLRSHVNHDPGTHNFLKDNREQLYGALGDYFYPGDTAYVRDEIASESEVKTPEELHVPLPDENVDFQRLARSLCQDLPHNAELPTDRSAANDWQFNRQQRLRALLRIPRYEVSAAEEHAADESAGVRSLTFRIGDTWSVPANEFAPAEPGDASRVLVIADAGRAAVASEVQRLVAAGHRVIAADPLLWGESKPAGQDPDYTFALFVATVGERPLGNQAAQLAAIARWARARQDKPIEIVAFGPRAATAALVAAAIEPQAIAGLELGDGLGSFKELIERNVAVEAMPELFAYGLLEECDVAQLVALAAPRPVRFRDLSEHARRALAPLETWYALFGAKFEQPQ